MSRFILSFAYSCLAFACMATNTQKLETHEWGYRWKFPTNLCVEADIIASTNTPGSCDFYSHRITKPSYYAFLDGFDTRAIGTSDGDFTRGSSTNGSRYVISTNVTARFTEYASLANRFKALERLSCGNDSTNFWSSTFLDNAMQDLPEVKTFSWTRDIVSPIYGSWATTPYTRWLSCFRSCETEDSVYATTNFIGGGLFYKYMIEPCSIGDPDVYEMGRGHQYHFEDFASSPAFDDAFKLTYGIPLNTNLTSYANPSARHVYKQMAQESQALAMFDKTIHVYTNEVAYTNRQDGYATLLYTSKVNSETGGDYVNLYFDGMKWHCQELEEGMGNHLKRCSQVSSTVGFNLTTHYQTSYSPRARVSGTSIDNGISIRLDPAATNQVFIDASDPDLQAAAKYLMDNELVPSGFLEATYYTSPGRYPMGSTIYIDAVGSSDWFIGPGAQEPSSGTYKIDGYMSINAEYSMHKTAPPRLPFGWYWYPDADYFARKQNEPYRSIYFSSYAVTHRNKSFDERIDFNGGNSQDWDYRGAWAYSAFVDDYFYPAWYDIRTRLQVLEGLFDVSGFDDPERYTGLNSGVIDIALTNEINLCSINSELSGVDQLSIRLYRGSPEDSVQFYDGTALLTKLPVASTKITDIIVGIPMLGVSAKNKPYALDTHIRSATEVIWDFPQITPRNYPTRPTSN